MIAFGLILTFVMLLGLSFINLIMMCCLFGKYQVIVAHRLHYERCVFYHK